MKKARKISDKEWEKIWEGYRKKNEEALAKINKQLLCPCDFCDSSCGICCTNDIIDCDGTNGFEWDERKKIPDKGSDSV